MTATGTGAVRIGNCSGYYGDRLSAMREMLEGGDLDYLTGDYLAELTMLILGRDQLKDPALGYAKTFVTQIADTMALIRSTGVRVVANAGGLNPAGLAERLRSIAAEQGVDLAIAHVDGDDLRSRAEHLGFGRVLTANAYLGAFGIAAALERGAAIVVTGRVTDASLVVGPAIAHHGWARNDFDALAGAVVAGHVIECGTQATGGNFSGFRTIPIDRPLGFPIAEIAPGGDSVITKHRGTGGAVTVDTVTAQLLYEVQGPVYLNPDVAARLDSLALTPDGPDRVRISGVKGAPPPPDTKVCLNTLDGFRNSVEFVLTGLDIPDKATWIRRQLEAAIDPSVTVEWHLARTAVADPPTQAPATSLLRLDARAAAPEPVGRAFSDAAVQVALASYPGFTVTRPPAAGTPVGVYRAAYLSQGEVTHIVHHADRRTEELAPPVVVESPMVAESPAVPTGMPPGPNVIGTRAPLGAVTYARSGDKGGDANVGVWVPADHPQREAAVAWLIDLLDDAAVRDLLPEAADLDIDIHPLPNLGGVNIVLHGLLGEGVASSTRFDPQAKALGEWLRARFVTIPAEFIR